MKESEKSNTNGTFFPAETGRNLKDVFLSFLRYIPQSKGLLIQTTATRGIAVSSYEYIRALNGLLGLGVDDNKDSMSRKRSQNVVLGHKRQSIKENNIACNWWSIYMPESIVLNYWYGAKRLEKIKKILCRNDYCYERWLHEASSSGSKTKKKYRTRRR